MWTIPPELLKVVPLPLTWTRARVYLRDPGDGESKYYVGRVTELTALGLGLQMESPERRDQRWWPMGRIQEVVDLSRPSPESGSTPLP
jgi:hypothetical protein